MEVLGLNTVLHLNTVLDLKHYILKPLTTVIYLFL